MDSIAFFETEACTSGTHCSTCRDREGGRSFRIGLARAFVLPDDAPEFECPHGKKWEETEFKPIETVTIPETKKPCGCNRVHATASPLAVLGSKERLDICEDCFYMKEHREWMYCEYEDRHINLNVVSADPTKDCPIGMWNIKNMENK